MIMPYQSFICEGVVSRWTAVVLGSFDLTFLVWKSTSDSTYTLVGRNDFRVESSGVQISSFEPEASERIKVKPGYVVGLYTVAKVRTGVQAVRLQAVAGTSGPNSNVTYAFRPSSSSNISTTVNKNVNVMMVPDVRPLITAEVGEFE